MSAQKKTINLLPKDEFAQSPIGKFFAWALTFGKYIVIITQIIVIGAFLFRFKLDKEAESLTDSLNKQQVVLAGFRETELLARNIHSRLNNIKAIESRQEPMFKSLDNLSSLLPLETEVEALNFNQNTLTIEGHAASELGISTLISNLQKNKNLENVNIISIKTSGIGNSNLDFVISIDTVKDKKIKETDKNNTNKKKL